MMSPLTEWQNFYVIVGSAAGGLTGLQFVTIALVADMPLKSNETEAASAFSTPSIVHFGMVLFVSAVLVMPWHSVTPAAIVWTIAGAVGMLYTATVAWKMCTQKGYKVVLEDWIFRCMIPLIGYAGLLASGCVAHFKERPGLFGVAGAALLLLFLGIHHAWDNVTYLVYVRMQGKK